ncbi:fam-m protein [Plasmodium malariae]|uniref:Fam-m protein n=1 Tax=Plasmodium malariae TaxID=5858 RepID=A0A1D3PA86_PLAMA|nr:fam-m protein [Plasmodium malariae]SCN11992.1 fam-m protein [Plasmodium malariae]
MERIIRLLLLIKITAFIYLTWMCHVNNNMRTYDNSQNEYSNQSKKLSSRNYRLLAKYKQDSDSHIVCLKEGIPKNRKHEEKYIPYNVRGTKAKQKQSNKCSLSKAQYYVEVMDNNNGIFDGKHFHFERKWIRKRDYDYIIEKNKRIYDIALKKIKFRSYGFGVTLFLIFLLLGIGLPILKGLESMENILQYKPFGSFYGLLNENKLLESVLPEKYFYVLLFGMIILILGVILIIAFNKILRNNEKYNKIKLMTQ